MITTPQARHHVEEHFGFDLLSMELAVRHPDGRKLLSEKLLVGRGDGMIDFAAVMRAFDAFANVI